MSTEMVKAGSYDIEVVESAAELMREELGDDFVPSFQRVKVPSGGGTAWDDPRSEDPDNPDQVKQLSGVVVGRRKVTRLFLTSFEERDAEDSGFPDAWSSDGKVQVVPEETAAKAQSLGKPVPLTDISRCPYHQFPPKGQRNLLGGFGKAANEYLEVYLLLEGRPLPVQVAVPATSIRNADLYFQSLVLHHGKRVTGVETVLGLKRAESKSGITYSQVTFARGADLTPEQATALKGYEANLKGLISVDPFAAARAQQQDGSAIEGAVVEAAPVAAAPAPETSEPAAAVAGGVDTGELDL